MHELDRGGSDIHGNWITGNAIGVTVGGDWPSHVRNNYLNNTDNGYFGPVEAGLLNYEKTAGPNIVGGPFLGGNFWASPNGTGFSQTHPDTDGDGFCDEPYVVNPEERHRLPAARAENGDADAHSDAAVRRTPYRPLSGPRPDPGRGLRPRRRGRRVPRHHPRQRPAARTATTTSTSRPPAASPNVGWIRDGEYLTYTVNVTTAGVSTMTARVASPNSGRTVGRSRSTASRRRIGTIAVPNTGSFATYRRRPRIPIDAPGRGDARLRG